MPDAPFFVSGGTLPLSAGSYVERAADRALFDALRDGRYAYVLNARQMGKSSLCVRTIARLEERGVRTAFVDLTRIGGRNVTPDQWYVGLLGEIGRAVGGRAEMVRFWKENPDVSPMQRFFGALAAFALPQGAPPLVVFVDEVDATRSLPFSADEFFGGVRECYNRRAYDPAFERLSFCLLGAAIPSDLIKEMEASPFNVGERIAIQDFSREEAMAFAVGLEPRSLQRGERGRGERESRALVERVYHWTGGHPFLTQSLCARLVETGAKTPAEVDRLVERDLFAPSARESNVNLADVGNRVLLSEVGGDPDRHRAEILALYDRVRRGRRVEDDESNPRVAILKLSGLVVAENGLLRMRNRIYARVFGPAWIAEHMPDGEARRVRRAYRVGLLRAAAAGAALLAVVGALGANAAANARRAETARDRALLAERTAKEEKAHAEELAARLQDALDAATRDRATAQRAEKAATTSALKESAANAKAQTAAARAIDAKGEAQRSAAAALVASRNERESAQRARESAQDAGAAAAEARRATRDATAQRDRAEALLYTSNLQLVGDALAQGSGVRAAALLAEARSPDGRPSWAERHYRAVLHEDALYPGHQGRVGRVAFAPNGDLLTLDGYVLGDQGIAPGRHQATLRRWSRKTGRLVGSLGFGDVPGALSMDLAPDGRTAVVALANGEIRQLSTDGFRLLRTVHAPSAVNLLRATSQPDRVLARQALQEVALSLTDAVPPEILDIPSWNTSLVPLGTVPLPNGDLIRAAGAHGRMTRFDRAAGGGYRRRWSFDRPVGNLLAIAVSRDGARIAYSVEGRVSVVDTADGRARGIVVDHPAGAYALAFSPDGRLLASGSEDGTTKLTRVEDGKPLVTLAVHHPEITALAFSDDGRTLAIGSGDGTAELRTIDPALGARGWLSLPSASDLALSGDGRRLLLRADDTLTLADLPTGRPRRSWSALPHTYGAAISPDARTVAVVDDDGRYRAWDADTGRLLADVRVLDMLGRKSVALGPGGRALVYNGNKDTWDNFSGPSGFALLDARTGRPLAPRRDDVGFYVEGAFSPDGARFVLARQVGSATVFDARTGLPLFDLPQARGDGASSLTYSPDGRVVVVGRRSGWLDVYDARAGRTRRAWVAHAARIAAVAFAPDGKTLLTLGKDDVWRTWDLGTGRSVGFEAVPGLGSSVAVGAKDGTAYFLARDRVEARRVGDDPLVAPATPRWTPAPDPATALRAAQSRARRSGRSILVFLRHGVDYPISRSVDPFLKDPEVSTILSRHFEIVDAAAEGAFRAHGRSVSNLDFWRERLGGPFMVPSAYVLARDGRVLWDNRVDALSGESDRHQIGFPEYDKDVEVFLRALRRASPSLTSAETDRLRAFANRNGRVYAAGFETANAEAALIGRIRAAHDAGRLAEEWTLTRDHWRDRPLDADLVAAARELPVPVAPLASEGQFGTAASLLVRAEREDGPAPGRLRLALALYGLAGDLVGARRTRDLIAQAPDADLLTALVPGIDDAARTTKAPAPRAEDVRARTYQALRLVRAGRAAEAEAEARSILRGRAASPADRQWAHQVLALALAYQGKREEARAELTASDVYGGASDETLLKLGQPDPTTFVLLRREILGLIGK